ncbi:MAG: Rha family transcriptional regulator [Betaproteobacteria bacterium]
MSLFLNPLPSETNLRMTSMQIAELCGKEHKNVLADIDDLVTEINSAENPAEWEGVIVEQKSRKSKRGEVRYFDLNENAALNIVSGYNRLLRN